LIRRFHHSEFDLARLLEQKREPVSVVLPSREVADTIGLIVERLRGLDPLIDQIVVVDAASRDGSAGVAARAGAEVYQEGELLPEFGQVLGKGDAMWRALPVVRGELVLYLDSDTRDFSPHFAVGMLGPLICDRDLRFVKGFFRRPYLRADGTELPADGGRVTELTARPLLSAFFPELAAFVQPLAGEVAVRRSLLDRLPFATGYAVETAMLLHARDALGGTDGMAQVDLDVRLNRHQPLPDLGPMAYAVLRAILERLRAEGRLRDGHAPPFQTADGGLVQVEIVERPPYARVRAGT
jgi:glucosyl-3-phosphoglycerate synthase